MRSDEPALNSTEEPARQSLASPSLQVIRSAMLVLGAAALAFLLLTQIAPPEPRDPLATLAFLAITIPVGSTVFFLTSKYFRHLSIVAGLLLVTINISAVVVLAHFLSAQLIEGYEEPTIVLVQRLGIAALVVGYLLRTAYLSQHQRRRKVSEQTAMIQALQSRIRPHFLFNSMNVIASLIPVDAEKAEQVVEDLSELFRASLQEAGSFVSISQELDLCRRYINIEGLRLGDRLNVQWNVETPPKSAEIPLLLIQPLIENAVYHGIQPIPEGGLITVDVGFDQEQMHLVITNPLVDQASHSTAASPTQPKPNNPRRGNSIAIDNIRQRLSVVYGENAKLITKQEGSRFTATLKCPTVPKLL